MAKAQNLQEIGVREEETPVRLQAGRDGNKVTVQFDLNPQGRLSSTGNSHVHYTTKRYLPLPGSEGYRISITVIKPIKKADRKPVTS
jgi:hypothetical protein